MATVRIIRRMPPRFRCSNSHGCNGRSKNEGTISKHISTSAASCLPEKRSSRLQESLASLFVRAGGRDRDEGRGAGGALVPVTRAEEQLHVQRKVWEEVVGQDNKMATEKFIPITRRMLVRTLVQDKAMLSPGEKVKLEDFAAALDAYTSQRFYTLLEEMKVRFYSNMFSLQCSRYSTGPLLRKGLPTAHALCPDPSCYY